MASVAGGRGAGARKKAITLLNELGEQRAIARTESLEAKEAAAKVYDTELAALLAILDGKPWATADETQAETYRVVGAGLLVEALHMLRALVEQQAHVFGAVDAMRRIQ